VLGSLVVFINNKSSYLSRLVRIGAFVKIVVQNIIIVEMTSLNSDTLLPQKQYLLNSSQEHIRQLGGTL
jgi:hypothetical protein